MKLNFIAILFLLVLPLTGFSQQFDKEGIPARPQPPRLVNDMANIIPDRQEKQMERTLVEFSQKTTTQIVVVTTPTLNNYDRAQFAYEIGEKWAVGDKEFDNGLVVLVKPKEVDGKGTTFIATGYGLEGIIPDAIAKRIVENEMIPHFKKQDYTAGINGALNILMGLSLKEYSAKDYVEKTKQRRSNKLPVAFMFILFFVIISLIARVRRARHYSMGHGTSFWTSLFLMSAMGGSHRGTFGDFSSGSGSFGGGGGFGGFGGGSFGGGGAGGSW